MDSDTIRDRVWLWGMPVNVLQEDDNFGKLGFARSTMTVEDAIARTGVTNIVLAGGFPISAESLASVPSAGRMIAKCSVHATRDGRPEMDEERCLAALLAAKGLASLDTRVEAFHLDDFSSGSVDAGVQPEHLARLQFTNAVRRPRLPLGATMYTMNLDRPQLPGLLPFFDLYLVPLWHADQIASVPDALARLSGLSGGKPMFLCLYVYDFGNARPIPRDLMQQHLDTAEQLLHEQRVAGLCLCGTCMMDLDWEANHCFYAWLEQVGDERI